MRWALLVVVLGGCDWVFLTENAPPIGTGMCGPEYAGMPYLVLTEPMPWGDAELACRGIEGMYSHLAVVDSVKEAQLLGAMITFDAWVGLSDRTSKPRMFRWITREPAAIPWSGNQPDDGERAEGNCGRVLDDGSGLADGPCASDDRRAICECDKFPVDEDRF